MGRLQLIYKIQTRRHKHQPRFSDNRSLTKRSMRRDSFPRAASGRLLASKARLEFPAVIAHTRFDGFNIHASTSFSFSSPPVFRWIRVIQRGYGQSLRYCHSFHAELNSPRPRRSASGRRPGGQHAVQNMKDNGCWLSLPGWSSSFLRKSVSIGFPAKPG